MLILFHLNIFTLYLVDDNSELLNLAEGQEANSTPTPVILAYRYANKHGI